MEILKEIPQKKSRSRQAWDLPWTHPVAEAASVFIGAEGASEPIIFWGTETGTSVLSIVGTTL